jgi:hypothetical protein
MVRYKVQPDKAQENEALIHAVFEDLKRKGPPGMRYAAFKLDDGVSLVHIVSEEGENGGFSLPQLEAFKAFTAKIKERCVEPPVATELHEVGSYRFLTP